MTLTSFAELAWHIVDPRGRCNRKGLLIVAALLLGTEIALGAAVWMMGIDLDGPFVLTLKAVFIWTAICAGSKRLHDLDLRAWWMPGFLAVTTLWTLVLVVTMSLVLGPEVLQPGTGWYMSALAGSSLPIFGATLWMHFRKGQTGINRFGIEPRGLGFSGPLPNMQPLADAMYRMQRLVLPAAA